MRAQRVIALAAWAFVVWILLTWTATVEDLLRQRRASRSGAAVLVVGAAPRATDGARG